jgi:hypothetical protein
MTKSDQKINFRIGDRTFIMKSWFWPLKMETFDIKSTIFYVILIIISIETNDITI